jgi:probable addiction module antidote protein
MARTSVPYEKDLMEWLQDPAHAAEYINAAIEDGDREVFLLALRDVAKSRGGMAAVAEQAKVSRTSLYKTLSQRGNPEFRSVTALLRSLGLKLTVEPEDKAA